MKHEYFEFVDRYFSGKKRRVYETKDSVFYSYSAGKGKFSMSNVLLDDMQKNFTSVEVLFVVCLVALLEPSDDYYAAGIAKVVHANFRERVGRTNFGLCKKKFIEYGLLIRTPEPKYFIVNPLYVSKYRKLKEPKQ